MEITQQNERLIVRLLKMGEMEKNAILKVMPADFKARIEGVSVRFEDKPGRNLVKSGVAPETLSLVDRDAKEITVFLLNLRDRFGRFPTDVRQNLRRVILQEFADWAGLDVDLADDP